jgi:hypothetical protein
VPNRARAFVADLAGSTIDMFEFEFPTGTVGAASPDGYEFRTLVAEQLARRGYAGVAVVNPVEASSRTAAVVSQLRNLPT